MQHILIRTDSLYGFYRAKLKKELFDHNYTLFTRVLPGIQRKNYKQLSKLCNPT